MVAVKRWFFCVSVLCFQFLKQFGEIEACHIEEDNQSAVITYKSRAEAEQVSDLFEEFLTYNNFPYLKCLVFLPLYL